jgi:hypothetical protein
MWTRAFWVAAGERAIRAAAATVLSALVVADGLLDAFAVDWTAAAGIAGGGAVVSLLTSLTAGAVLGPPGSPSLVADPAAAHTRPG